MQTINIKRLSQMISVLLASGSIAYGDNTIVMHYRYDAFNQEVGVQLNNNTVPLNTVNTYDNALGVVDQTVLTAGYSLGNNTLTDTTSYDYLGDTVQNSKSQNIAVQLSNVTSPSDSASGHAFVYNSFGEVESDTNQNSQATTSTYDANGNQVTQTDLKGGTYHKVYNNLNEVTESYYMGSSGREDDVAYDYNPKNGELEDQYQVGNQSNTEISYTYLVNGLISSISYPEVNGKPPQVSYTYDTAGRVSTFTDVAGGVSTYTYNSQGEVSEVSLVMPDGTNANVTYSYDTLGRVSTITRSNGVVTTYTYDGYGRVAEIKTINNQHAIIADLTYTYDNLNNITSVTNGNSIESYTYDVANRMVKSIKTDLNHNLIEETDYAYDANDNITEEQITDTGTTPITHNYLYNKLDQLMSVDGNTSFKYDANGNMLSDNEGNTYTYNDQNQLTSYTFNQSKLTTNYSYYVDNDRASKFQGTTTINFFYDNEGNLVDEEDNNSNMTSYLMGTSREARALIYNNQTTINFYAKDQHGNILGSTNSNGNLTTSNLNQYNDYGVLETNTTQNNGVISISNDPYQYSGEYTDNESGLQPLGNGYRYYSPQLQRFISQDSYTTLSNLYTYSDGNPIMNVDPSGHLSGGAIVGITAAAVLVGLPTLTMLGVGIGLEAGWWEFDSVSTAEESATKNTINDFAADLNQPESKEKAIPESDQEQERLINKLFQDPSGKKRSDLSIFADLHEFQITQKMFNYYQRNNFNWIDDTTVDMANSQQKQLVKQGMQEGAAKKLAEAERDIRRDILQEHKGKIENTMNTFIQQYPGEVNNIDKINLAFRCFTIDGGSSPRYYASQN